MKSKGPPQPMSPSSREGERLIAIGGSAIGSAFGVGGSVIISGDNYGQVAVALNNCVNMIRKEMSEERRGWLEALRRDIRRLIEDLPDDRLDEAPQVAENLEMLVRQATSEKPNRKWFSVSAEGLLEAAKWVDFSNVIAVSIKNMGTALWADFRMPNSL